MKILLSILLISISTISIAQNWNWVNATGNNQSLYINEIKKGNHNDVFICGTMKDTIILGNDTLINNGIFPTGFIARLDTSSNIIWTKMFNVYYINFTDMEVNSNNELVLLAGIKGNVILDTVHINYFLGENVIIVLNENGQILKTHNFGDRYIMGSPGGYNNINSRLDLDSHDNPIIAFNYLDTAFFQADTIIGNGGVSSSGIIKLNTNLQEQWLKLVSIYKVHDIALDIDDDIIIVGQAGGSVTLDTISISNICGMAGIVAKLDNQSGSTPTFIWQKNIQSINGCAYGQIMVTTYIPRVDIDMNNNIYFTGSFMNIVNYGGVVITPAINTNTNFNMIVSKLNTNGDIIWYKTAMSSYSNGIDLSVDKCGNVYFTGAFNNSFDIGIGHILYQLGGSSYMNLYVGYIDTLGSVIWTEMAKANSTFFSIEKITNNKIWIGGHSHYISMIFGTHSPISSLAGSLFLAEISQSNSAQCIMTTKDEIISNQTLNVYPNPSNGKFTITQIDNLKSIEVSNLLGEIIYYSLPNIYQTTTEIDLTNQPRGVYFLKIDNGEKLHIEKVVLN